MLILTLLITHQPVHGQTVTSDTLNTFSTLSELHPASEKVFIITHADLIYDRNRTTMAGITQAIQKLQPQMPVVLLSETADSDQHFLLPQVQFLHQSQSGEFKIKIAANQFYLAGGFLGMCLDRTKEFILQQWDPITTPVIELNYITDGIYGRTQFLTFLPKPMRSEYDDKLSLHGEINLLTMADFLSLIERQDNGKHALAQFAYNWLANYEKEYQVTRDLQSKANVQVWKDGQMILNYRKLDSENVPTILIRFVRSDDL